MTKEQEHQIIQYLLDKRLSLDVASEIFDHMSFQVIDLMQAENISFDEAWLMTKRAWQKELSTTYDVMYSLDDITLLMRDLQKKQTKSLLAKTIPLTVLLLIVHFAILFSLPKEFVPYFMYVFLAAEIGLLVYFLVKNRSLNKLQKKFGNNRILSYQGLLMFPLALPGFLSFMANFDNWELIYRLKFSLLTMHLAPKEIVALLLSLFVFFMCYFVISVYFYSSKKVSQNLDKMQGFIAKIN